MHATLAMLALASPDGPFLAWMKSFVADMCIYIYICVCVCDWSASHR